jgi:hypothetical protein
LAIGKPTRTVADKVGNKIAVAHKRVWSNSGLLVILVGEWVGNRLRVYSHHFSGQTGAWEGDGVVERNMADCVALPSEAKPYLLVVHGQKPNITYPIHQGRNIIGRMDEKPVDIDLEAQELPEGTHVSRQHVCISFQANQLSIEDLNSSNGTYLNFNPVHPGKAAALAVGDVIHLGNNVRLQVVLQECSKKTGLAGSP